MTRLGQRLSKPYAAGPRGRPVYGPSFEGGTLSAVEARLALRLFARPLLAEPGQAVAAYEREFARAVGVPHAVAFGKARVALWAILRALEIGPGDDVVIPGYTCVAVPNAVRFAGANPIYADIDPFSFNMTAARCERVLTPRTRAIVVGHTYGLPAPMDEIKALAEGRGVYLIEDAAHALGSEYGGRPVGSLGQAGFFSTELSKTICTGLGGMATTANGSIAARLRLLQAACPPPDATRVRRLLIPFLNVALFYRVRQQRLGDLLLSRSRLYWCGERGTPAAEHTGCQPPGYHWRMGDAQALLGLPQLRLLPQLNAARRAIVVAYEEALEASGLQLPSSQAARDLPVQPVFVRFPYLARRRAALLQTAATAGLELGRWFESPVHPEATDLAAVGYALGSCPESERTSQQIVNLPCHPGVTAADIERYVDLLVQVEG